MKPREDWIGKFVRRQDNIDPIRRIANGALFEGTLILGRQRLNKAQRVGAAILGFSALAVGGVALVGVIAAIRAWRFPNDLVWPLIFAPFSLWAGCRVVVNALVNNPKDSKQQ